MKKYISILFISIYLFSFQEVRQLLKLPNLMEHFLEDRQIYPGTSFAQFIIIHYFKENKKDADYKEDMKLPFKNYDFSVSHFTLALPTYTDFEIEENPQFYIQQKQNFSYQKNAVREYCYSIFQPPEFLM